MTKMTAMNIYGKTFKNLLSWNQKSYDLEPWHAASGTELYIFYKWRPWVDLDLLYDNAKFGETCFVVIIGQDIKLIFSWPLVLFVLFFLFFSFFILVPN